MTDLALNPPHAWLEEPWQELLHAIAQQRVGQAWLVTGAPGMGQLDLVKRFAAALACTSPLSTLEPCDECKHCQLLAAGNYPDLITLQPETNTIKIAQVRELINTVSTLPTLSSTRLVIIEPAETLHRSAANALLKTLEEPTPNTVIVLISYQPHRLPATVISRCRRLHCAMHTPQVSAIAAVNDDAAASLALALCDDAPLAAQAFQGSERWQQRQTLLAALWQIGEQGTAALAQSKQFEIIAIEEIIAWLYYVTVDLIRLQHGLQDRIINQDIAATLTQMASRLNATRLFGFMEVLLDCQRQAQRGVNLNKALFCDYIILQWRGLYE